MGPVVTHRIKQGLETENGAKVIELRDYRDRKKELERLKEELEQKKAKKPLDSLSAHFSAYVISAPCRQLETNGRALGTQGFACLSP